MKPPPCLIALTADRIRKKDGVRFVDNVSYHSLSVVKLAGFSNPDRMQFTKPSIFPNRSMASCTAASIDAESSALATAV